MKKIFYLLALLLLSLTFVVSCDGSSDKKDEPELPPPPPPPAPTTADSLQGTWYSYEAKIAGTVPASGPYTFTTGNLIILTRDTLNFSSNNISHTWNPVSPSANFPHKVLSGTFSVTNGVLTNAMTSMRMWYTMPPSSPTTAVTENHIYKISFKTNVSPARYSKDTLTLVMTGSAEITNNKYNPAMGIAANPNTSSGNEPIITLKFKRKP